MKISRCSPVFECELTADTSAYPFEVSIIINNKKDYIIKLKEYVFYLCFSDCKIRMAQLLNVIIGLL